MMEGQGPGEGGEGETWKQEVYEPGELPKELLDLPGDVRAGMGGDVTLVWKRMGGEWVKWVVVMESAVLKKKS